MIKKIDSTEEKKIMIREIPLDITLGELAENVRKSFKIMEAIHEGRANDAFNIARDILNTNDAIIERQVDKHALMQIINSDPEHIWEN